MRLRDNRRKYISLFLTGLIVASAVTFAGAVSGFEKSSTADGDSDWTTDGTDAARANETNDSGPRGPYANTDWSLDLEGRPAGAAVEGDTVYLGSHTVNAFSQTHGKVVAYDQQTGEVRWNRSDLGEIRASPTVVNGTVYVAASGIHYTDAVADGTGTPGLFALDAETGETKWRNNATKKWTGPPTVDGDTVYARSDDTMYVIDAETGETVDKHQFQLEENDTKNTTVSRSISDYAVVDDTAYLSIRTHKRTEKTVNGETKVEESDSASLVAVNTNDWSREWSTAANSSPAGLTVANGGVYWTVDPNNAYKFEANSGAQLWQKQLDNGVNDSEPDTVTAPTAANGTVYVGTDDDRSTDDGDREVGTTHALDARSGHEQWRFRTAADIDTKPTVTSDTVYVGGRYPTEGGMVRAGDEDEHPSTAVDSVASRLAVYAVNRSDGSELWSYGMDHTAARMHTAATVAANGHLYAWSEYDDSVWPTMSGHSFYALNASDQRPDESHRLADDEPKKQAEQDETPRAQIATDPEDAGSTTLDAGTNVTLNASTANDLDDRNVTYEWDVDNDGNYERTGESIELTTAWCGEQAVTLQVTDEDGNTDQTTVTLSTT